jgi:5-methylcytosine-specific restriction endonuclease McrA
LGDPNDHRDDNLISACGVCHRKATGKDNAKRLIRAPRCRPPEPHPGAV